MSDAALLVLFFGFVLVVTAGAGGLFLRWLARRPQAELAANPAHGLAGELLGSVRLLGEAMPAPGAGHAPIRKRLIAAGYRSPSAPAVFSGAKLGCAAAGAIILGWVGLLDKESLALAAVLAVCGAGFGFLAPDRVLTALVGRRAGRIDAALPAALDLMVLSIEAGQTLDYTVFETGRELAGLYPELSSELHQSSLGLRAGRSRQEVLGDLGSRTASAELKKAAGVLLDSDRFGTSLGPALRTHARYLRSRRRHAAQESARKLGVKLIFPVFFLIMPSVFVITLGPAVIQIYEQLIPMITN